MDDKQYRGFLQEAFIHPMRSVLIVDDDYPTLEDMLAGEGAGQHKRWRMNCNAVWRVIDGFHKANPPLVVDVHDGSNVDPSKDVLAVEHLHQCDLLILDFELDRTREHDGSQALRILQKVLGNRQFNLVVLHSRTEMTTVFSKILTGLLRPAASFLTPDEYDWAKELIFQKEMEDTPGFSDQVMNTVGLEHYLYFRKNNCCWPPPKGSESPDYSPIKQAAKALGLTTDETRSKLARYFLHRLEEDQLTGEERPELRGLEWSDAEPRWIRSDSGFIAFTRKPPEGTPPEGTLIDDLTDALASWGPAPSRLFLARLRAELDRAGVVAESKALGNSKVLAHWYKRLLVGSGEARDTSIAATLSRHTDMLMDDILPEVREYAMRMLSAEKIDGDADALCLKYFGVNLADAAMKKLALNEHNAFVCSKPVEGHHLVTGHIFKLGADFWVCLTPMCDLVPEQSRLRLGTHIPVMAAKLARTKGEGVPENINDGAAVVLKLDGDDKPRGYAIAAHGNSQPEWRTFYASDNGRLLMGAVNLSFMAQAESGMLGTHSETVKVVAQLRYEYALSLMHRLGSSMTRVGLDFEKTA